VLVATVKRSRLCCTKDFFIAKIIVLILQICEIQEFLKEGWALEPFDFGVPNRF
jgi:hypothetical protein